MLMSRGSRRELRRNIFGKGAENGARLGGLTPCITHCHIAPAHAFLSSPKGFTARGVARRRAARGGARGSRWNSSGGGRLVKVSTLGKGRRQTCSPSLIPRS